MTSFNPQGFHLRRQGETNEKTKHKMICFKKPESLIGRDEEADFQITDVENTQSISRKHFRILFREHKMFIEAVEGKKVIVNGKKLEGMQELAVGTLIGFGRRAPGSDQPAVQYKVEGCITLDSSDEELDIKHESIENLVAGFDEFPGLLEQEHSVQVISDDEEYEKAKSWQEKLQVKGKNGKNSRSTAPLVRIEKSSSQSNDTLPEISELPQASSTPRASKTPPAQKNSSAADEFYPTSSLCNLPPMRRLVIELEVLDENYVQRMLRRRIPTTPARGNAAPKKRKTRKTIIKRSLTQSTAYDRVQAVVDPDSQSEEDSDTASTLSLASSRSNGSSENRGIRRRPDQKRRCFDQEDANNNRVPPTQRKGGKPGTSRNVSQQTRKVAGPRSVKQSMGIPASDDSRDASEFSGSEAPKPAKKPRGPPVQATQQRKAIMIAEAVPITKMKRRMSTTDLIPTTSSTFNSNRRVGAEVSGHHGKETAHDQFSKAYQLRTELKEKHQAELEKTAQLQLAELERKEHKPLVNTGTRIRVSRYAQKTLEQVAPTALKSKSAEAPGTSEVKQKLPAGKNSQEKPEASKPKVQAMPKVKVTRNNRSDLMLESMVEESADVNKPAPSSSNDEKLPLVSSLPRIPRISERRTSESDKPEASDAPASHNDMQERIQKLRAQYANGRCNKPVTPATLTRTDSSSIQNRDEPSTSFAGFNIEAFSNKPATKPGFKLGFYNPIETPFDSNSSDDNSNGGITIDVLENEPPAINSFALHEEAAGGGIDNEPAEPAPPEVENPEESDNDTDNERPIPEAPRVFFTPDSRRLSSILKRGPNNSGRKKSLTIAEHLNEERTFYKYEDDVPPKSPENASPRTPENPPANFRARAKGSPRFNQSPRPSPSPSGSSSFLDEPLRASESPSASSMIQRNSSVNRSPRFSPSPTGSGSPSTSSTNQRHSSSPQDLAAPRDRRVANSSPEAVDYHAQVVIQILRWSSDEMDVPPKPLKASYDKLLDFHNTAEPIVKYKMFQKIRDSLDEAAKEEERGDLLFLKRYYQKNGLTRLVLSCNDETDEKFTEGDFLQVKLYNKTANCQEKFFGHIKATQRELPFAQMELYIDTIVDMTKLTDISVMMVSKLCSIICEVITLMSLEQLTETEIVKKMLRPAAITSPAVITQKLFPSRNGFVMSPDQSLVVSSFESSFDKGFKADQGISVIEANPGAGKTTTLVECVLLVLEKAKKQKIALPSIVICAKTDAGVKALAELLLKLTKEDSGFSIVINNDIDTVELKPITLRTLAKDSPPKEIITEAHVVITKLEHAHELFLHGKKFDICFVDEASRCSELETIIPLYFTTKKLVLFGDTIHPRTPFEPKKDSSLFERIISSFNGRCQTPVMNLKTYQPCIPFVKYNPNNFF